MCQSYSSYVQWVPESLVRLGAQKFRFYQSHLEEEGYHPESHLDSTNPPFFAKMIHFEYSKSFFQEQHYMWGAFFISQSSTIVDMFTLFLELTMKRVIGMIEAVISRWQDTWRRETQLTQPPKCFTYIFKYGLSWGFMKNPSDLNMWLFDLYRRHFFSPTPNSSTCVDRTHISLGKPASLLWSQSMHLCL